MDSFTTFPRLLFMMTIIFIIHSATSFDCSPSLGSIKCECTTRTAECSGTQVDILEAEPILTNFSNIENVTFKINDLQFDSDFVLENSSIKNLTLGYTKYGLQVLSSNFFSGLSSNLISLNLQNNSITNINDYFFSNLSLLIELFLDNNEIENLTLNTFINLKSLKHLSISHNKISDITPEVFESLVSLKTLILSHNKFSSIENINIKSTSLIELNIDNCLIEGLIHKDTLTNIPNTEKLDISYNKLSGVESHSLSSLKDLKYLNLSYNAIEYLEENAFSDISNLTTLDLQGNQISVIKLTSFEKLQNLIHLDLSSNKLKAVLCEYTTDFTSLERIDLHNNEIKDFTPGAFFYSPKLKIMDMTGNNLECSCPLTDTALYLIENGTMESTTLESVPCIISSTGAQLSITKYESSKCIPVEPCKVTEVASDEEDEYDYEDEISSTITTDATPTIFFTTEKVSVTESTTLLPTTQSIFNETETTTNSLLTTPGYNTSSTMSSSTDLEDTNVPFIETTTILSTENSVSDNISEEPNTTLSEVTTEVTKTSTKILTTTSIKPTTASTESNTNESFMLLNETTTDTSSTPVTERFLVSSSTVINKVTSPDLDDCSSLQLSVSNESLSTNLTILKNFSNNNNMFCLKWTVGGIKGLKIRCSIKFTTTAGTKVLNLQCPSSAYEIKEWTRNEKVFKFCIVIYPEGEKKKDSCALLVFGKNNTTPTLLKTITTTLTTFTTTPIFPTTIITTLLSTLLSTTTTESSTASTERSMDKSFTLLDETTTDTTKYDKTTTKANFVISDKTNGDTTDKIIEITSVIYSKDFSITALNLYFNDSKLAFTTWTVNKRQSFHECNLTLKVSTQYFEEIEGVFPCRNNTYRLTKVKETDIFKVCLFSHHVVSGKDNLCQHTLPSVKASTSGDDSLNSSLIPLICLLILFVLIIIFIVFKNISKRRSVSKKYDVQAEEEKYQERVKLRPQSSNEESMRFSYIAKENHEYI